VVHKKHLAEYVLTLCTRVKAYVTDAFTLLYTQSCMLGCRDYIEQSMYRPRVGSALPSSKRVDSLASAVEQHASEHQRALDQLNTAPGRLDL